MMTPSEAKALGGAAHITAKKTGNDSVSRKASFKCHVPNKATSQRIARKVVLPMSTVQALTFKFNELSQMNQAQKHKITQSAVKTMLGVNGKPSTIKVVICRKPSSSKYKRAEDAAVRRRVNVRKFPSTDLDGKQSSPHKNVHQKISEYEEMKKGTDDSVLNQRRVAKMQAPKILVDIDLSADHCSNGHKNSSTKTVHQSKILSENNSVSVRTVINLFEKTSGAVDKKNVSKPLEDNNAKEVKDVRTMEDFAQEVKTKPIAAIKPILKKPEARKTKLSPKDSINRKKYMPLKRDAMKENKKSENERKSSDEEKDAEEEEKLAQAPSAVNQRLKNNSSLHKQISQSSITVITDEIFLSEDKKSEQMEGVGQNLKPNTSFLWSKKEEPEVEKRSNRIDLPLPVPPETVPNIPDEDSLYDDVRPISEESEEEFDKITDSEEETYDDVGVDWRTNETNNKRVVSNKNNLHEEVRNKNIRNEISSMKVSEALYDNPEKCLYSYDDGEGERYQYISDKSDCIQNIPKQSELEVYQYIQNNNNNNISDANNDNNIYEDIQTIKSNLTGKDKSKDIYEDINCVSNSSPDNASIINCYEAVYNGIYSNGNQAYIKSDLSDASNNSGRSTYEKSNSLYGMSTGNAVENSHFFNLPDATDTFKNSTYHMPIYNSAHPNSETSQSNSDEWVEVSESESEETVYVVQERPRKIRSGGNTWTQKERRRWKRLQKKSNFNAEMKLGKSNNQFYQDEKSDVSTWSGSSSESSIRKRPQVGDIIFISSHSVIYLGDFENKIINLHAYDFENGNEKLKIFFTIPRPILRKKFKPSPSIRVILYRTDIRECQEVALYLEEEVKLQSSEDHFYESVGQYENTEVIAEENVKTLQPEQPHSLSKDQIYLDEPYVDDFDSQSSEDETFVNSKLPELPSHGYNITKSLKAAGQKLRKNFSLRKSDLSKSLKRFKKSRPKVSEVFADNKVVEVDSLPKTESPSTPTNLSNSIYFNNSDSSSSSHNLNKSGSSDCVKTSRHRKSWTFRSKFKTNSLVDSSDNTHMVDSNRNSTFYLSLNDTQPKSTEKKDELLNEIQTVISQRNSNSSESVSEKLEKDGNSRHSDGGTVLTKSRPSVPPPPPPVGKFETTEKTKYCDLLWGEKGANNSLYLESGLFDKQKKHSRYTDSDSSLYAEIGLYAASDEVSPCKKTQMFTDEPLYQFYTECVNQRARDDILNNYDSEGYEEINDFYSVINEKRRTIDIKNVRPNFEDFNDDVRPKIASFRSIADRRTLWCHIPAVIDSCILESLNDQARKLQEAKFEIVTSEASYMKSLNVLENHFMKKVGDLNMISKRDFRILFSNIVAVKKCSETFLEDLEKCWEENIMLNGICDIVYKHATSSFQVYTKYCKNQVCIYRTLRELIDKNSNFESALKEMENDPICQNLNIHSFLMLPMQRITRLPLLMGAVLARLDKTDDEYDICKASFDVLNKIVQDCDDEARRMEKCEEMLILSQQIEFPKDIRRIPIITGSRFLVKSGQVTQLINRDENKLTFGKKFSKVSLTLFLFTDLLIIAKKKNIRNYVVVDHCPRNLVQMQTTDGLTQLPVKLTSNSDTGGKLLMLLTMLENHEKKTVEMILSFEMESDRQRWLEAVTPKLSENPDECIYEEWDCPQVISLYEFTPAQPDELNLCIGDVVNVLKKMNDGWYQGERLRDGARGWFPQNHTQEISSSHVRAKNKKLRYKLLALSGNLIDSQKINGK